MKTVWYRLVHFVRNRVLGKPKYYIGVDFGYGVDDSAVTLAAKHKDGSVTVEWLKINPTIKDLEEIRGKVSQREWEKLMLNEWE